jgi:hypothetical protein
MTYSHTLGPWVAPAAKFGSKGCTVWTDDGLVHIADCRSTTLAYGAAHANARLIAAAPDLLDCVRGLIEDGVSDALLHQALIAFAKATGKDTLP